MRGGLFGVAVILASCSRTGLDLDDGKGGGSVAQGLSLNCRADSPIVVPIKERRWVNLPARSNPDERVGGYLVEVTPDGPQNLIRLPDDGRGGATHGFWSASGRFFSFTRLLGGNTFEISVLDLSRGAPPIPVPVPPRPGSETWSPTDDRYFVVPYAEPGLLAIVDATTGAEKAVEISANDTYQDWSPDGRHISLFGSNGLSLVDTFQDPLVVNSITEDFCHEAVWSPDGRYLAYSALRLYVYDTLTKTSEHADVGPANPTSRLTWFRNEWIGWISDTRAYFLDVSRRPLRAVRLEGQEYPIGVASPGGKCLVYRGDCRGESGLCLRTLPPDERSPPIRLGDENDREMREYWAGTGDHLVIDPNDRQRLIHIALDGRDIAREIIADGTDTDQVAPYMRWNPSGRSDWFTYVVGPTSGTDARSLLWHRQTQQTFAVETGEGYRMQSGWSPDGRYFLVESGRGYSDHERVLVVQEVLDGGLGKNWRLEGVYPAYDNLIATGDWQP